MKTLLAGRRSRRDQDWFCRVLPQQVLDQRLCGLHLAEGRTGGAKVLIKQRNDHITEIQVTLTEGKNREVRRVFARFGYKVKELHRVAIGPLKDRGLSIGHWRQLGAEEVAEILAAGHEVPTKRPQRPKRPRRAPHREDGGGSSKWGQGSR